MIQKADIPTSEVNRVSASKKNYLRSFQSYKKTPTSTTNILQLFLRLILKPYLINIAKSMRESP